MHEIIQDYLNTPYMMEVAEEIKEIFWTSRVRCFYIYFQAKNQV